jgi:hypothetical protein
VFQIVYFYSTGDALSTDFVPPPAFRPDLSVNMPISRVIY